ncbi:MAG: glycogen debranching protein [Cyanobacteria bacterium P01_C01_bin.89]
MVIWVNEQIDGAGILRACIACENEEHAQACRSSFEADLSEAQRSSGWVVQTRTVGSWDDVPVSALKLSI